ncbi:hypothetical protein [Streptomyces sp.]|uniref:hypothetical protein n=1 Tax=Streptomyces sp. TaxID=1931 RepID=UPI002F958F35
MKRFRLPKWTWATWLAGVAVSFAVLETIGLLTTADGDTLSEATRRWLGIDPVRPWRIAGSVGFATVLLGFTAWFLPHIVFRWGWWQPFKRNDDKAGLPPVSDPKSPQVSDTRQEAR